MRRPTPRPSLEVAGAAARVVAARMRRPVSSFLQLAQPHYPWPPGSHYSQHQQVAARQPASRSDRRPARPPSSAASTPHAATRPPPQQVSTASSPSRSPRSTAFAHRAHSSSSSPQLLGVTRHHGAHPTNDQRRPEQGGHQARRQRRASAAAAATTPGELAIRVHHHGRRSLDQRRRIPAADPTVTYLVARVDLLRHDAVLDEPQRQDFLALAQGRARHSTSSSGAFAARRRALPGSIGILALPGSGSSRSSRRTSSGATYTSPIDKSPRRQFQPFGPLRGARAELADLQARRRGWGAVAVGFVVDVGGADFPIVGRPRRPSSVRSMATAGAPHNVVEDRSRCSGSAAEQGQGRPRVEQITASAPNGTMTAWLAGGSAAGRRRRSSRRVLAARIDSRSAWSLRYRLDAQRRHSYDQRLLFGRAPIPAAACGGRRPRFTPR